MNDACFLGMDIVTEVQNFINLTSALCTDGMSDNELKAYNMGIQNALSALRSTLENDGMPVVNIEGIEIPTELTVDDIELCYNTYC